MHQLTTSPSPCTPSNSAVSHFFTLKQCDPVLSVLPGFFALACERFDQSQLQMSEKRKNLGVIHRRKWLTLEQKLEIIKAYESGKTCARISRETSMCESSVRSILRKKERYKREAAMTTSLLSKGVTRQRSPLIRTMENLLVEWIEECNQKRIQLTEISIQQKALALFEELKQANGGTDEKFVASRGWFYRFKTRINLQNCIIDVEKPGADMKAVEQFCAEFREIVEDGGYTPQQIFNVEETYLQWKKIPSQTFTMKSEKTNQSHKPSNDGLTLLLGSNAAGDFKLKPLLVYRVQTPLALRDSAKNLLPVIWRSNAKAWLDQALFEDWFNKCFSPAVETYCQEQNIEYKILLLLDFAPIRDILYTNKNIKVVFMPTSTAQAAQPMSQGIISKLKACYLRQILSEAVRESSEVEDFNIYSYWKSYNIRIAIDHIASSWNEITAEDITSSWCKLLPNAGPGNIEAQIELINQGIISMAKIFGIDDLNIPSFDSYVEPSECPVTPKHEEEEKGVVFKEEMIDVYDPEYSQQSGLQELTVFDLERIIESVDAACETILVADPDVERSIKIRQVLQSSIQCYRDIHAERSRIEDT